MSKQEHESFADAAIIDTSTKNPIDRDAVLELLKSHRVKTASVENSKIPLEDIIPALRKAKVNIPEIFFKIRLHGGNHFSGCRRCCGIVKIDWLHGCSGSRIVLFMLPVLYPSASIVVYA